VKDKNESGFNTYIAASLVVKSVLIILLIIRCGNLDNRLKELEQDQPPSRTPNTPHPSQPDAGH